MSLDQPAPPYSWSSGIKRSGWTLGDQTLSSLTNMALAVMAARNLSSDAFGAFALVFAIYLVFLGISRALSTDALGVRFSTAPETAWRAATAQGTATAVSIGLCGSTVLGIAALLTTGVMRSSLAALAVVLPGLLLQDAWRFAFFAAGRPQSAVVNDGVWVAVLGLLVGLLLISDASDAWHFIGSWGAAATAAALVGIAQSRTKPALGSARKWLRSHQRLWPSFLGEFAVQNGVGQLVTFGVASIAGLSAAGALRGAQVMFGPINVLLMAVVAMIVPEGARLRRRSLTAFKFGMLGASLTVAAGALAWGLFVWIAVPESAGETLLGDTWSEAAPVLPWLALLMATNGMSTGAVAGLRIVERPERSLAVRAIVAPLLLVGGLGGAAISGAPGAIWGQIGPLALGAALWWHQLLRLDRQRQPSHPKLSGLLPIRKLR